MTAQGYWPAIASRWGKVGAPLRPTGPDLAAYQAAVDRHERPRVLMLGVTPEIHGLAWPAGTDLLAVDHTLAMFQAVWPGPPGRAVLGDWSRAPLAPASRDLALCDGGFHLLSSPDGQVALVETLARVLAPGGLFVTRLFVPPERPESADAVIGDLLAGRVADVNVLKLRLAMALQAGPVQGVELASVWSALFGSGRNRGELAESVGWDESELSAIDSYRECRTRYHFATLSQVRELFCRRPGGFDLESVTTPGYELGERFPTVTLRRRVTVSSGT